MDQTLPREVRTVGEVEMCEGPGDQVGQAAIGQLRTATEEISISVEVEGLQRCMPKEAQS